MFHLFHDTCTQEAKKLTDYEIPSDAAPSVPRMLAPGISARLLVDTTNQIFNPFLPIIAAGLGVSVITVGRLVSLRSLMGLIPPALGAMAERYGYRTVMRLSLMSGALGTLLVGSSVGMWMAIPGMMLMGIGFSTFIPTMHAYLSARLPYAVRARSIGILEYSWAFSGILGLFLAGQLIDAAGWRAPFFVLSGGLLIASVAVRTLPECRVRHRVEAAVVRKSWPTRLAEFFDLGQNALSAWNIALINGLLFYSWMHVTVIHGEWLSREYGLGAVELGRVALILGLADFGGSAMVSLVTDRVGKLRSMALGIAIGLVAYAVMPFLNTSAAAVVAVLTVARFSFEFGVVSSIPLLSEQVPSQRGKVLMLSGAFVSLGITLGGITGPWAYIDYGAWGLAPVSFAAMLLAMALTAFGVKEIDGGEG